MPRVVVEGHAVVVPPVIAGADLLQVPAIEALAGKNRTVFLVDPTNQEMEIVDPQKQYTVQDGTQVDAAAASRSGWLV